jgi:hypothetical protein
MHTRKQLAEALRDLVKVARRGDKETRRSPAVERASALVLAEIGEVV